MSEPIDFTQHRRLKSGDDGHGELLFTTYHYERGHVVHVPAERVPGDPREIWGRMFRTLWFDADHVYEETGDKADQILLLLAIAASGRVVSSVDDREIENLNQVFWLQRMLECVGREDMPPFKCYHANENQPKEPTDEHR